MKDHRKTHLFPFHPELKKPNALRFNELQIRLRIRIRAQVPANKTPLFSIRNLTPNSKYRPKIISIQKKERRKLTRLIEGLGFPRSRNFPEWGTPSGRSPSSPSRSSSAESWRNLHRRRSHRPHRAHPRPPALLPALSPILPTRALFATIDRTVGRSNSQSIFHFIVLNI